MLKSPHPSRHVQSAVTVLGLQGGENGAPVSRVRMMSADIEYGCEYLGNSGRLVVSAAPLGPAHMWHQNASLLRLHGTRCALRMIAPVSAWRAQGVLARHMP